MSLGFKEVKKKILFTLSQNNYFFYFGILYLAFLRFLSIIRRIWCFISECNFMSFKQYYTPITIKEDISLLNWMFMSPCNVSIFYYTSNKMQRYTVRLYLESALHVSGGTSTLHQEHIQLYLQHLVFVTPLLLPAAITLHLFGYIVEYRTFRIHRR